jgi:hypothetical protein
VLHVTALEAEMLRPQNGNSDLSVRISRLMGQLLDSVDFCRGLHEAILLGQNAVQGSVSSDLPGSVTPRSEGCRRTTIRLLCASRFIPPEVPEIKKEPGMVRLFGEQLLNAEDRLPDQAAVTTDVGETFRRLFRVRSGSKEVIAGGKIGRKAREPTGSGRQEEKGGNRDDAEHSFESLSKTAGRSLPRLLPAGFGIHQAFGGSSGGGGTSPPFSVGGVACEAVDVSAANKIGNIPDS